MVKSCFEAIRNHGDEAIFITLTEESALEAARASDKRRAAGIPLSDWDGIPVAWKDLVDIPGTPTTAASAVYENAASPDQPAVVYANCEKAGLISVGKTNLSEFAYSGLGLNPHFGTPVNPHSKENPCAPGGSSAGSAAAVAAGLVSLAIGTDTAGSVRVPAAFCGVMGFKSSQQHYDKTGVFPLSTSLDSLGIFAHSIEDLVTFDQILRGVTAATVPAAKLKAKIIVPTTIVLDDLEDAVASCFQKTLSALEAQGYEIEHKDFPIFSEVSQLFGKHGTLTVAEAATYHKDLLASPDAEKMDQRVRERMLTASQFTAQDYVLLQWERARLEQAVKDVLGDALLLFPTVAITAPLIAELEADDDLYIKTNLMSLRNTMLGNYLGMPGVSLPIGHDADGLPIGVLVSGPNATDVELLQQALSLQQNLSKE
nr:amidase family protein [Epibacterium ulvae]